MASTEIQEGEYVRVDYEFGGSGVQIIMRDPLGRMADGLLFRLPASFQRWHCADDHDLQIGVEFYKRADWEWLSLSDSTLAVPPEDMATFEATMEIPSDDAAGRLRRRDLDERPRGLSTTTPTRRRCRWSST